METIIKAYGLITRCYDYDKDYGYGCTECCNGDRCDEDCTARYKGGRRNCPHCKGKGRIPKEEATVYPTRQLIDDLNRKTEVLAKLLGELKKKDTEEQGIDAAQANYDYYCELAGFPEA